MPVRSTPSSFSATTLLALLVAATAAAGEAAPIRFSRDVRPILADACFHCHGPDAASRKAGLRLDTDDGFFAARGESGGPVVMRGKPEASALHQRLVTADADELMPPAKTRKVLPPEQKELIRRWIAEGAQVDRHWSLAPLQAGGPPQTADAGWARNPIDRFVRARLEREGLAPAPEADRRTLARRVSLDLTGLPPAPERVEAFVADKAPDAYEKLVDELLASPRYGEHRGRYWLDAARYADTHGLHFDNYREMWLYRDWVIGAFNRNLAFDRFTIEQLAGDLLPSPTQEQRIATGFHRCNITTNEGGTIAEENLAMYARDRVETTAWVWLGLTANCAACHDHKYDPITQRDFYSLAAYFRNTTQGALDGNNKASGPVLKVMMGDESRMAAIKRDTDAAAKTRAARAEALKPAFDAWAKGLADAALSAELDRAGAPALHLPLADGAGDRPAGAFAGKPITALAGTPLTWVEGGRLGKAAKLGDKTDLRVEGEGGALERDQSASFGCWVRAPKDGKATGAILARMDDGPEGHGWDLHAEAAEFAVNLVHKAKDDAILVRTTGKALKRDAWQHVLVTYDGSSQAEGVAIYVDGKRVPTAIASDTLHSTIAAAGPLRIGRRKAGAVLKDAQIQDVRFYARVLAPHEAARLALTPRLRQLAARSAREPKEIDELRAAQAALDPANAEAEARLVALAAELKELESGGVITHVQEEKPNATPKANILFRGEYDKPREEVGPGVIAALHPLPSDAPKNRLGLAQWLVAKDNPLTARVTVNRFWQEIFGVGLVRTAEDFGAMGEAPSHPELLDWLAIEFRDGGWDVKKLMRLLVTSAAYRQAAVATPEKLAKDPQNRLLSRGPRFRMDGEMVRDLALRASGLLVDKLGGAPVKPYQPDGVWDVVGFPGSNTRKYVADTGESLYRRSVYTFWKRMAPPPTLELLNAPNREVSCLRRERTNTPQQALATLNDPQFVEAARVLAGAVLKQPGSDAARFDAAARRVLGRALDSREQAVFAAAHASLLAGFRAKPDDAAALLKVGASPADPALDPVALAALTLICNALLNLDEALCK